MKLLVSSVLLVEGKDGAGRIRIIACSRVGFGRLMWLIKYRPAVLSLRVITANSDKYYSSLLIRKCTKLFFSKKCILVLALLFKYILP
jgi:hypothetical protein